MPHNHPYHHGIRTCQISQRDKPFFETKECPDLSPASSPRCIPIVAKVGGWVIIAALATAGLPGLALAATLEVGTGKPFPLPSAAAAVARDGDRIAISAGSYSDCAVWTADNLTIEGEGADSTVITGTPCDGKALFIVRGNAIVIRALALTNAHVGDFNGAGIRAEGGDLTVEHVRFVDDEDGILAGSLPGRTIIVRDSAFIGNGSCAGRGGCAHGIYVGRIGLLRIERTRFFETRQGHHIKSRAERTEIVGCDIADGGFGTASFSVDVPNGGAVLVRDTHIQKGPRSQNHSAAIMIGAEGVSQPTPEIVVEGNVFLVEGSYTSYLVNNVTATEASLRGNTLQGNARALHGDGSVK